MSLGTPLLDISRKFYVEPNEVVILKNDGKLMLLDFWFTSCAPCIYAIPDLNRIYDKYGSTIKIIGINPLPDDTEHTNRIAKFHERIPIKYHFFLSPTVEISILILFTYPTIYIFD